MFSFDPNKIDWTHQIDSGFFGVIHPYKKSSEDERFVVKYANIPNGPQLLKYFQEIVLGFSCKHENVLPVRGYHIDYDQRRNRWEICIKLDRMKSSLKSKILEQKQKNKNFSEKEIVKCFYEMSCGLEYLHNQGIAHRDIKPANVLINEKEEIKIADIGLGKFVDEEGSHPMESIAGTPCYMAPEIAQKKNNANLRKKDLYKADIWSLGVVMAELCLLRLGIIDIRRSESDNEENIIRNLKDLEGKIYDKALLDLIANLLRSNPTQRKSLHDIKETLMKKYEYLIHKEISLRNDPVEQKEIKGLEKGKFNMDIEVQEFKKKFKDLFMINFEDKSKDLKVQPW